MLDDLINNPNFGRLFASSGGFRTAATKLIGGLKGLENIFPTLQIGTQGEDNEIVYSLLNREAPIPRLPGQTNTDYLASAFTEAFSPINRQRTASTMTGPAGNRRLKMLEDLYGVKFNIMSYNMAGKHAADRIEELTGRGLGLTIVDSSTSTILQMEEKGEMQGMKRILEVLGINPKAEGAPFKRIKAFTNETEAELIYGPKSGRRVSFVVYDPAQYFRTDMNLMATLENMGAKAEKLSTGTKKYKTAKQFVDEALDQMADGTMLMSRSSFDRVMTQMEEAQKVMQDGLANSRLVTGSREYLQKAKEIKDIGDNIREMKREAEEGISFTLRAFNGVKYGTDEDFIFGKAEATVISDDEFFRLNKVMNPNLKKSEVIQKIDFMTMSVNEKIKEFTPPTSRPAMSWATLQRVAKPKTAVSNTLTTATFSGLIDPGGYLNASLRNAIEKDIQAIQQGRIPDGIMEMIEQIRTTPIHGLDPAEAVKMREAQAFGNRLKVFLANGGDLTKDPFITEQLIKQVKDHYFISAKQGGTYTIDGVEARALSGRFPMEGSSRMHLESTGFTRRETPMGVIRVDHKRGKYGISGRDTKAVREAMGGFDFDDDFYGFYRYDHKTKRILQAVYRDPNQMGEYYIFDADITHDKNIPWAVREEYRLHEEKMKKMEQLQKNGKATPEEVRQWAKEVNQHKKALDDYFSGREVELLDKKGRVGIYQQNFIRDLDVATVGKNGLPTPAGSRYNVEGGYSQSSITKSMKQITNRKTSKIAQSVAAEREAMRTGTWTGGVFEYMYEGYNEYYDKYFKMPEITKAATRDSRVFDAKFVREALESAQQDGGVLGRAINQYTLIDEFISSHLDYFQENHVDQRMRSELDRILKNKTLTRIDREALIDAVVKGEVGSEEVARIAKAGLSSNMEELGRIIRELDDFAAANNINFKAGIDPTTFTERLLRYDEAGNLVGDKEQADALARGYGGQGFLLPDTDIKARQTERQRQQRATLEWTEELDENSKRITRANLSADIGDDFTPAQLERARMLINDIETANQMRKTADWEGELAKALKTSDSTFLDSIGREGIHVRTIAQLDNMKRDDILAIARVLLDSGGNLSILNQASELPDTTLTVESIYNRALNEDSTFNAIGRITSDFQLDDFIQYDPGSQTYRYTDTANAVIDTNRRNVLMREAWERARRERTVFAGAGLIEEGGWSMAEADFIPFGGMDDDIFEGMGRFVYSEVGQEGVHVPRQLGELAQTLRTAGDQVAEDVISAARGPYRTRMTRFGMAHITGETQLAKNVRSGLMGLGLFAIAGIAHRLIKGDRDISAANPYPLIPQDSKYESILANQGVQTNMTSGLGGSTRYIITANNVPDARALSGAIQGVLPNGSSTIYNSNAYQLSNANSNSSSILAQRLGS